MHAYRSLLQTVQQVMMMHLKVGIGLAHQCLSCFFGCLSDTNTNHMTHCLTQQSNNGLFQHKACSKHSHQCLSGHLFMPFVVCFFNLQQKRVSLWFSWFCVSVKASCDSREHQSHVTEGFGVNGTQVNRCRGQSWCQCTS